MTRRGRGGDEPRWRETKPLRRVDAADERTHGAAVAFGALQYKRSQCDGWVCLVKKRIYKLFKPARVYEMERFARQGDDGRATNEPHRGCDGSGPSLRSGSGVGHNVVGARGVAPMTNEPTAA